MNLRTLKKLSKRAAPYLPLLGDHRQQFRSKRGDNYHGMVIAARKHWERMRCHPSHREVIEAERIVYTSRAGNRISMRHPFHPRKGTIMIGGMTGYYEPEWDEQAAWAALCDLIYCHFTDWCSEPPMLTRAIRTPRDIFAAAEDILAIGGAA